jgi:hypothetical protein
MSRVRELVASIFLSTLAVGFLERLDEDYVVDLHFGMFQDNFLPARYQQFLPIIVFLNDSTKFDKLAMFLYCSFV